MFSVLKFDDMQENYHENSVLTYVLLAIDVVLLAMVAYFEYKHAVDSGIEYLNPWNIIDIGAIIFSWFVTICILVRTENPCFRTLRILACFASLMLLVKLYDWMRIFDATAFYIQLVQTTFLDIGGFIFLLLIGLMAFGFPMLFINMNWGNSDDTNILAAIETGLYNNYLIALGEFPIDDWNEADSIELVIITILFIASTFFAQILLLNMLIAIISSTFAKVTSRKESNSMQTKV